MSFKDISYLEVWWPFCSAERIHLCNLSKGYQEEQFCEIILKLGPVVQKLFKKFLIRSSGGPCVWRGTIYAILVEGIIGNIHLSYFKGPVVQEMSFKEKVNRQTKTDHNSSPAQVR